MLFASGVSNGDMQEILSQQGLKGIRDDTFKSQNTIIA